MASTVANHLRKLVEELECNDALKEGGRTFVSPESFARQCRCSTPGAVRLMANLAFHESLAIDGAVGSPGHVECEVDSTNCVGKNTSCREATRTLSRNNLDSVRKTDAIPHLQSSTAKCAKGKKQCSTMALDWKHVLEQMVSDGVKFEGDVAKEF